MSDTPMVDREEYTIKPNDIGFKAISPSLGRILERIAPTLQETVPALKERIAALEAEKASIQKRAGFSPSRCVCVFDNGELITECTYHKTEREAAELRALSPAPALIASAHREERLVSLLREWLSTEMDSQDEDYEEWMRSFVERVTEELK